jgi:hypothetical protein
MTSLCCSALESKVELMRKRLADFKKSVDTHEGDSRHADSTSSEVKTKLAALERALETASEELRLHLRLSHGR